MIASAHRLVGRRATQEALLLFQEDLPTLGLLAVGLGLLCGSLALAGWVDGLGLLFLVLIVALLGSYLLAVSTFGDLFGLSYAAFFGVLTVWMAGALSLEGAPLRDRISAVAYRSGAWLENALSGGFSSDSLIFFMLLAASIWYLTFNAVWNLFRVRRIWYAVTPAGLMLVINAYYYAGPAPMEVFVAGFLFVIFLMSVQTYALDREALWISGGAQVVPRARTQAVISGLVIVMLVLLVAWLIPPATTENRLQNSLRSADNPFTQVQEDFDRLFGAVESDALVTNDYYASSSLAMSGPVNLSDIPVMRVSAPQVGRYYWRAKVFDTYAAGRWVTASEAQVRSQFGALRPELPTEYAQRLQVQQNITVELEATSLVYAAPQPVSFAALPITYEVIFTAEGTDFGTVTQTNAQRVLLRGESYNVSSSLSIADALSLRAAGTDYPAWVTERYLTLPQDITQRTRDLAASMVQATPYDTARAIEAYLREHIAYNEQVPAPPDGAEPVDYVLFERPEGYCTYYASAMAVMLRSQGIPTRLGAGFSQGQFDPVSQTYLVRESNAHVWVEVYFPGYGWVEFEPTAAESPLTRPEAVNPPEATPTPTPTLPPAPQTGPASADQPTPTPQPGQAAPPPTADEAEAGRPSLGLRLTPLVLACVGLFGSLGLMLLAAWYWLEWRGMAGLSEVGRAYTRMNHIAEMMGVPLSPDQTPYERGAYIAAAVREGAPLIERVTQMYVEERYSQPERTKLRQASRAAQAAWHQARPIFLRALAAAFFARLVPSPGSK